MQQQQLSTYIDGKIKSWAAAGTARCTDPAEKPSEKYRLRGIRKRLVRDPQGVSAQLEHSFRKG
jgi:hypothetical protein